MKGPLSMVHRLCDSCPSPRRCVYPGARKAAITLLFVLAVLWLPALQAQELRQPLASNKSDWPTIVAIEFEGNKTTQPVIMLQEMTVAAGDPADPVRIEESRQNVMNLGIFERVEAETRAAEGGGAVVVIRVKEKYYIVPLPRLSRSSEGDISYGAKVSFHNLLGYNQSVELLYEETNVIDGTKATESRLSYDIVRIPGTPLSFGAAMGRDTRQEVVQTQDGRSGRYDQVSDIVSLSVGRWLTRRGPSKGWHVGLGTTTSQDTYDYVSGDPYLRQDESVVTMGASVQNIGLEEYTYNRGGAIYGGTLSVAMPVFGSDEDWQQVDLFWRRYKRLGAERANNLNIQLRSGIAFNTSALKQAFKLGGADSIRGYERDALQGDAYVQSNFEYLHSSPWTRRLRGVAFIDIGNAYPYDRIDLTDLESGVGVGLRYKIPWLVRVDLRIDVAQGLGSEGILRVYAGTRASF